MDGGHRMVFAQGNFNLEGCAPGADERRRDAVERALGGVSFTEPHLDIRCLDAGDEACAERLQRGLFDREAERELLDMRTARAVFGLSEELVPKGLRIASQNAREARDGNDVAA